MTDVGLIAVTLAAVGEGIARRDAIIEQLQAQLAEKDKTIDALMAGSPTNVMSKQSERVDFGAPQHTEVG